MLTGGAEKEEGEEDLGGWFVLLLLLAVQASIYCASERRNQGGCHRLPESVTRLRGSVTTWKPRRLWTGLKKKAWQEEWS